MKFMVAYKMNIYNYNFYYNTKIRLIILLFTLNLSLLTREARKIYSTTLRLSF